MILFNADDYGIYTSQAERILHCNSDGCLNGVSIFVNTPEAKACAEMLAGKNLHCRLHLNLVEGPCMCRPSEVPLLVNGEGKFCLSFPAFFGCSLMKKKAMKQQLKAEIKKQIHCFFELTGESQQLRIDSHRHYHMIPIVWDALFESCQEEGISIVEIRIPKEPFFTILKELWPLRAFPVMGFVKNLIFHVLYVRDRHFGSQPDTFDFKKNVPVFLGITFSTKMFEKTVRQLLPAFRKIAAEQGRDLELMFHPGGLTENDKLLDERFREFYLSSDRKEEAKALCSLKIDE